MEAQRRKTAVAWLSVISNATLVAGKLAVGLLIGSVSVLSEAIHSGVDLLAAVIALFAVRTSHKSADEQHPFGHGKIENLSGTAEAVLIFLAAGWIIYEAIDKLLEPQPLESVGLGCVVMLASALVNLAVSHLLFKVGKETDSIALRADAWHLRTDVYTSAGVMAGLGLILIGNRLVPGVSLVWLDPAVAIVVALLIVRAAWTLTLEAGRDLMDASLPPEETEWIQQTIKNCVPSVRGIHHLHTRKAGARRFIECHVVVDESLSVGAAHVFSDALTAAIRVRFPDASVVTHIEPCDGSCRPACVQGCLLPSAEQQQMVARFRRQPVNTP